MLTSFNVSAIALNHPLSLESPSGEPHIHIVNEHCDERGVDD